jgi:hypothetical protein
MKMVSKLLILAFMTINLSVADEIHYGYGVECNEKYGPILYNTERPGIKQTCDFYLTWLAYEDSVSITLKKKPLEIKDQKISLGIDVEMYSCEKNKDDIYVNKRYRLRENRWLGTIYLIGEKKFFRRDSFWKTMTINWKDVYKKRAEFRVKFKLGEFLTENEMEMLVRRRFIMKSVRLSKADGRKRSFQRIVFRISLSDDDAVSMELDK